MLAEGNGTLTKDQYFTLRSIKQGQDSNVLNLEFRNQDQFDPTQFMSRHEQGDFSLLINDKKYDFLGYLYGDGGPMPDGTGNSDVWFAAIVNYNTNIQLIHSKDVSTVFKNPDNPEVVSETKPTDEELELGKLILQSIRDLNKDSVVTYKNEYLGITMQVPSSWKMEDSYTPAQPPILGSSASVKISDANGIEIANIYSYIGGFGWYDLYEGTGNPNVKVTFSEEKITIAGKVEILDNCFYNGDYAESLIIVDNASINEWEGYYLEVADAGEAYLEDM